MTNGFNAEKDVMVYSAVCNPMIFHKINDTIIDLIVKKHIKKIILYLIKRLVHTIFIELKGHRTIILKLYCATPKLKICHFFSEILNLFLENTCTRYIIQKFNVLKTSHIYYLSINIIM